MAIRIGSNISSLTAQRSLSRVTTQQGDVFQRLSSGRRINRASDDAAGLAIALSLHAASRVYTQGVRNINDGISVLNIAEGALGQLADIATRISELSEQAANGVYSGTQRVAVNKEASALTKEYNRIVQSTAFNGVKILDGVDDNVRIQHGLGVAESTELALGQTFGTKAGDGSFAVVTPANTGSTPYSVTTADFNGDGKQDLISADQGSTQISIQLGNGDGTFSAASNYASTAGPRSVTVGDFNNDGNLDFASADTAANQFSVRLGRGDGTFGSLASYATTAGPPSITTGDKNGDGILDIFTADRTTGQISIRTGRGDGTFGAQQVVVEGTNVISVATGDANNDGILDIFSVGVSQLFVNLGRADGSYSPYTAYSTAGGSLDVKLGDLNGDGNVDVVSADFNADQVSVRFGVGDGTFGAATAYTTGAGTGAVTLADFNGDGVTDLASADFTAEQITVRLGNANGTFEASTSFSTGGGSGPDFIASADLNGDGVVDLISTNQFTNAAGIFLGNADSSGRRNNLLKPFDLTSIGAARTSLTRSRALIETLARERGNIGAVQSRLNVSSQVLSVRNENYRQAESRITDTDVAADSSELVRTQILQKTAVAVLAQANQEPALAIQLLKF